MCLSHANRQLVKAGLGETLDSCLRDRRVVHPVRAVNLCGYRLDLFLYGVVQVVQIMKVVLHLAGLYDGLGRLLSSLAALGPYLYRLAEVGSGLWGYVVNHFYFLVAVARTPVYGHHDRNPEQLHVLDMFDEVLGAFLQRGIVLLGLYLLRDGLARPGFEGAAVHL